MLSPKEIIDKILVHEYDPIKAHEYYLRTRELKGRKAGQKPDKIDRSSTTDSNTSSDPDYARKQAIKDKKHFEIDARLAEIERGMAPVTGEKPKLYTDQDKTALKAISDKRQSVLSDLAAKRKARLEEIANDLYNERLRVGRERYAKLERVPEVPEGLGVLETRRRQEARAKEIAKIKGDAQSEIANLSDAAASKRSSVVQDFVNQKATLDAEFTAQSEGIRKVAAEKVKGALNGAVEEANGEYERLKKDLARLLGRPGA